MKKIFLAINLILLGILFTSCDNTDVVKETGWVFEDEETFDWDSGDSGNTGDSGNSGNTGDS
ncbi:MAG TPA: hypothetical protein PLT70_10370, partial [bacterium]|nr:hypothetical protein [bacterium]